MIGIEAAGYTVLVGAGILAEAAARLPPGRFFLVSDANVAAAGWTAQVASGLGGRLVASHVLPPGEANKNLRQLEALLDAMLDARLERNDHVLAVGGGTVGDVAGLAAALLKRGCRWVVVPTTLLALADAAIGGKTAVNARQGKNLIGAFHAPAAVIADVATLATLPAAELRAGYAEIVKYGLIGDPDFFGWCERRGGELLAGDEAARLHAVAASIHAKIGYVAGDERDLGGQRALLNFGHTFGHAIEAETGMRHGEAVALGMALAFRLAVERGRCPPRDAERVVAHLAAVGLPTRLDPLDPERLVARMAHDKKQRGARLRLILPERIGKVAIDDSVGSGEVASFLERELASARLPVG